MRRPRLVLVGGEVDRRLRAVVQAADDDRAGPGSPSTKATATSVPTRGVNCAPQPLPAQGWMTRAQTALLPVEFGAPVPIETHLHPCHVVGIDLLAALHVDRRLRRALRTHDQRGIDAVHARARRDDRLAPGGRRRERRRSGWNRTRCRAGSARCRRRPGASRCAPHRYCRRAGGLTGDSELARPAPGRRTGWRRRRAWPRPRPPPFPTSRGWR